MIKSSALYCCRPRSTWGGSVPTLVLGKCCQRDATPALTGFETGVEQIRRDGVNERAKQCPQTRPVIGVLVRADSEMASARRALPNGQMS